MGGGIEKSSIKTRETTKDDLIPEGMWGRGAIYMTRVSGLGQPEC